jgi:uncharacterized membrane protein
VSSTAGPGKAAPMTTGHLHAHRADRVVWPGVLIGVGLAGTLDEVVLHQLLAWHHFYDGSTSTVGLVSDGIFHVCSTVALVAGVWLLLVQSDRWAGNPGLVIAWVLIGIGGFNLYDGTIQHKVLKLHQVRAGADDELLYDVVFVGLALVVLLAGLVLLRRARARAAHRLAPAGTGDVRVPGR